MSSLVTYVSNYQARYRDNLLTKRDEAEGYAALEETFGGRPGEPLLWLSRNPVFAVGNDASGLRFDVRIMMGEKQTFPSCDVDYPEDEEVYISWHKIHKPVLENHPDTLIAKAFQKFKENGEGTYRWQRESFQHKMNYLRWSDIPKFSEYLYDEIVSFLTDNGIERTEENIYTVLILNTAFFSGPENEFLEWGFTFFNLDDILRIFKADMSLERALYLTVVHHMGVKSKDFQVALNGWATTPIEWFLNAYPIPEGYTVFSK